MKINIKTIVLLALFIIFTACKDKKEADAHAGHSHDEPTATSGQETNGLVISKKKFDTNGMLLGKATETNFAEKIRISGVVDVPPQNKAVVSSFVNGFVKSTHLLVGDKVRKGQALAVLENPEFVTLQQKYLEVVAELTYLKQEAARQQTLFDENITSNKKMQRAKSAYKANLAKHNGLAKQLKLLNINPEKVKNGEIHSTITIYSPINGQIAAQHIKKGMYVSATNEIFEIIDTDHIHLELNAFEKDLTKIKKGQKIEFTIPEVEKTIREAEVHLVGVAVDKETRTVEIHGHLDNESGQKLAVGMFVEAAIITKSNKAISLPTQAVIEEDGVMYILVVKSKDETGYVFEEKEVKIGRQNDEFTELLDVELSDLQSVVIKGAFDIIGAPTEAGHSH